jgi:hypothetical protein
MEEKQREKRREAKWNGDVDEREKRGRGELEERGVRETV